jgi:anaerobic selenocysteine-containing dehydrogenase
LLIVTELQIANKWGIKKKKKNDKYKKNVKKETCGMCPWACPVGVGVRVREGEAGEEMHE